MLALFITKRLAPLIIFLTAAATTPVNCSKPALQPSMPQSHSSQATAWREGKPPIIFIPGILGSRLVNRSTGETVWPDLKVGTEDIALPISSPVLAENRDEVVATEVLEEVKLSPIFPTTPVYSPLLKNLEINGGYRRASFIAPPSTGASDAYYLFPYDWRRDIVESARALGCMIEELKRRLGRPDLRFDIVAHSMGGLIARYYAMYGVRDVLDDQCAQPDWSGARNLGRIVMIATPNAGSMSAFRVLLRGYAAMDTSRRSGGLLRKVKRQLPVARISLRAVFTAPAIYQLLPPQGQARFFDGNLTPLSVELYDVETWRRYTWSAAFNTGARQRELARLAQDLGPVAGEAEGLRRQAERERFLCVALRRAEAFHNALMAPSPPPACLQFIFIGSDCVATLDGAIILTDIYSRTIFKSSDLPGQKMFWRKAAELIFTPGDGIVTRHSFLGHPLDAQSPDAIPIAMPSTPDGTAFFCKTHNALISDAGVQNDLLTTLLVRQ